MKYLILILFTASCVYAQDTLIVKSKKIRPKFRNYFGVSVSPAVMDEIVSNNSNPKSPAYTYYPSFTTSFYLEYNRILSKRLWITAGTGIFINTYFTSFDFNKVQDRSDSYKATRFETNYNYSFYLKPKWMITNKKLLFYVGLSAQLKSFITAVLDDKNYSNNKLVYRNSKNAYYPFGVAFYGGVISGIGYNYKRFSFVAEPEIKIDFTSMTEKYNPVYSNTFIPYSIGINLIVNYIF